MALWKVALAAAALLSSVVHAGTVVYDFNVTWVNRNPDGLHERRVQGINGQWPIPQITANVGDRVIVNLYNGLGDAQASLHFHGLYQNGTTDMDGVGSVTQCPIGPGSTFTYNFTIDQPGTYWYHSHIDGQYPDGLRGALIVHDPENPYANLYDEELVLTLSDWYHDEMPLLTQQFLSVTNPTGAEPVPKSALMNDTQNLTISVEPGKTYFMRIINVAAFAAQYFWIEGHDFRIIEVDGVYHEPADASMLYIATAQRYGILLTTKNTTNENFAIVGAMDQDLFDKVPPTLNPNVTSYLVYDQSATLPTPALIDEYDPYDDMTLIPTDGELLLNDPAQTITLELKMDNLGNGVNYAFFNDITYVRPVVPTLYTVLTSGELATNEEIYGTNTHSFVLGHNQVIEMVLNNHDSGKHPFHLHGHAFQSLVRSDDDAGDWDANAITNGSLTFPKAPMRRDTLVVRPQGHFVIRYRSDNPGVWLFHCHIEWHVISGLIITIVEAPLELQKNLTIPADHYAACSALSPPMPSAGNAAANTVNFLDLTGQNVSPAPLPAGFTPRGVVALVFSCIAGVLGIAVITWYGMGEMSEIERQKAQGRVDKTAKSMGVTSAPVSAVTTGVHQQDGSGGVNDVTR